MWIETAAYWHKNKNIIPTRFTARAGELGITVNRGSCPSGESWYMSCDELRIYSRYLGAHCKTASQAKHEAISIVRRTLDSLSKDTKEIELATAIQAIKEELGVKQ